MIPAVKYIQLAHWSATRFLRHYRHLESESDDVHAEAMVGLMKACRLFAPDRGVLFTTYGACSISRHLGRVFITERMKKKRRCPTRILSFSAVLALPHGGDVSLLDTVADSHDEFERADLADARWSVLRRLLPRLHPREREVIRLRFWEGLLLREVAERLGVTRQRVQQIENDAMRKMGKVTLHREVM